MEKKSKFSESLRGEFMQRATAVGIDPETALTLAEFVIERNELSFRNGMKYAQRNGKTERVAA